MVMRTFYDMVTGEFIREEIGAEKKKGPDFTSFWSDINPRRRYRPEPKPFLGQPDIVIGETYSVKPLHRKDDE